MRRFLVLSAGWALVVCALPGIGYAKDSPVNPALESALRSEFPWARADGRSGDLIEPGPLFIVRKDGISTNPANAPFHAQNNYKDGQVRRSALNIFAQDQATAGKLFAGDAVYITKTEVKESSVVLSLLSAADFGGMRAKASVAFQFPKNFLATADIRQVAAVVAELLEPAGPPNAPPEPIPPSDPAPAPIAVGATLDHVLETLGQPDIIADLGRKQIYIYPDCKVTFLDGIAAAVE